MKGTSLAKGLPQEYQGKLELTADGGSWHMYGKGRDPCSSREVPVEIKSVDDKRLVATVKFSAIADYCKDSRLVLERDEQGRVTGRRGDTELTLSKQ